MKDSKKSQLLKEQENSFQNSTTKLTQDILLALTLVGFLIFLMLSFLHLKNPKYVNYYLIIPIIFFLAPYLILTLYNLKKVEMKMKVVPRFFRDIVDSVDAGRDVITSILHLRHSEYGSLNKDVSIFANQLEWGVSFEEAISNFAKNIGSKDLTRDLKLIIESRRIGGHVETILKELSEKLLVDIARNKERRSNLSSNTTTGYISYLIFLVIIVVSYNSLLSDLGTGPGQNPENITDQVQTFLSLFIILSYETSVLSGFLFGFMQDNNILAGTPHVVALSVVTFLTYFIFVL